MAKYTHMIDGVVVDYTAEEETLRDAEIQAWNDASASRKLSEIKQIRLHKLKETDWYSNSDVTMPNNIKTFRQSLRDIPANHTDEDAYDLLLVRDADGNLTHSIWVKP
jgi:hypothetical protein